MKLTKEEKSITNSVADSLFRFSLNLLALSLLNRSLDLSLNLSGIDKTISSNWYVLAIICGLVLGFCVYFKLPLPLKQQWMIDQVFNKYFVQCIKYIGYIIVLVLTGRNIIIIFQTTWSCFVGYVFWGGALFCLYLMIKLWAKPRTDLVIQDIIDRMNK
jgi:hypothetical protein